jgi:hypothetical protein
MNIIEKTSVVVLQVSKEVGPKMNAKETKYVVTPANKSYESMANFKYLGTQVIIKKLNWGHASYHAVQNLLPSRPLSKSLYASPTVVRVIKSRIRWKGHVARVEKCVHSFGWKN